MGKLTRKVEDLDSLRFMMNLLKEVRIKESSIDMEMNPVMDMYHLLENYLPSNFMDKEEVDKKTVLRSNWRKLVNLALSRSDELSRTQLGFKSGLLKNIAAFRIDVGQVCRSIPLFAICIFSYNLIQFRFKIALQFMNTSPVSFRFSK